MEDKNKNAGRPAKMTGAKTGGTDERDPRAAFSDKDGNKTANSKNAGKKKRPEKRDGSFIALCVLAGVLAAGLLTFGIVMAVRAIRGAYLDSGKKYREEVLISSEHHSVNAMMLSFRFYDSIYSGDYGGVYTDPETLKQTESPVAGTSLFDYYEQQMLQYFLSVVRYAEKATENGFAIDDADRAAIAVKIRSIENEAANNGQSTEDYLFSHYGRGMKLSDIEDTLCLERLADKQRDAFELEAYRAVSDSEIEELRTPSFLRRYDRIDYYVIDFGGDILANDTAEEKAAKSAAALERAKQLAGAKDEETFVALARELLSQELENHPGAISETVDDWLNSDYFPMRQMQDVYEEDDAPVKWLFSYDRKDGDLYFDGVDPTVYYVARAPYSIDVPNDAYLVINLYKSEFSGNADALDALDAIVEEWEAGEKTREAFEALARKYAQSRVLAAQNGYYDNTAAETSTLNAMLASWAQANYEENGELPEGTTGELYGDTAVYFVYYLGRADLRSRVDAREQLIGEKCTALYKTLMDENKVTVNRDAEGRAAELYDKNQ